MANSSAVDLSAVARVVGIQTIYKNLKFGTVSILPQRIAIVGQGSAGVTYPTDKRQVTSATQAGNIFGHGSPVHLAAKQLLQTNGDGVGTIPVTIYPLTAGQEAKAAVGDVTITGAQLETAVYRVVANGIQSEPIVANTGEAIEDVLTKVTNAVNAVLDMPVIAKKETNKVTLTTKWAGASSNLVSLQIQGPTGAGLTFALTQPVGGILDPDVAPAIKQIGSVWETTVLNCLSPDDTDALNKFKDFGESRWGSQIRKPLIVITGTTAHTVDDATAITEARKTDRVNVSIPFPGSSSLPFVAAARAISRIAVVANENPACDYGSQPVTGITPGDDAVQWQYTERDLAVKRGSSTVDVRDGVINLSDVVTMYHPVGEDIPAYRYVCDIVKLQNIIFNFDLIFATREWDGAPLIPDDQPTTNPRAKKPSMAVAAICSVVDSFGLEAIISDPDYTKKNTQASISPHNPKRLDVVTTVKLSGNTNILSVDLNFGFYFGTAQIVG